MEKKSWIYYLSRVPFVNFMATIIVTYIFAFFFVAAFMSTHEQAQNAADIRTALVGTLTAIIGYFFGSSRSSKARDEVVNNAIKQSINSPVVATVVPDPNFAELYKNMTNVELLMITGDTMGKYPAPAIDAAKAILNGRTVTPDEEQEAKDKMNAV